ncbi:MAG: glycine--tRNA ligase [Candidatus Levybacteria bacterium RIFCSPHIGHO2_02_FULL_40_18]|nr:MAG: glycine--tRNA ligase [Candidatus Levybacteria bacterium RIFCSPHIGHO2_01_FULL_40_58]OGH27152.1 MAG: glycine--tRNA ligase [Candidatus Levybacteria bacterium RIFCSPHIGHO2_02_FULL_40_18]OGH31011.1 MAG: glycine--tRNA ligase [Candidatus Levybacteria bacterium RIFCSPHIGHO2_12_FULL_40_31]OGH41022.1 MAG: glycine--tRNA ligase [Candidatus Levybacteria bacterium RIFCSPLOWO2_01_FULL_40_64]OGH49456.1 MAG: glycine--tRNA ligase [Candidatus Levybacteria bacterium RIFCSPLOWO2_02_FULL_41_11]OGH53927.1 MA
MGNLVDKVVALAKRRGFVYPSSEIYGGLANTWDFGPMGTLLKNNIRDLWWNKFVLSRDDMVGLDASIFLSPKIWEASGHVASFTDALIDCRSCHYRTRADHLIEDNVPDIKVEGLPVEELTKIVREKQIKCPKCGKHDWTQVRRFNLLFETSVGIIEEGKQKVYLRGEIAQGIFINFKNVLDTTRVRIPFGIAQVGKAFRNEITLGQFVHRTLEFDLMEFEYFLNSKDWEEKFEYFKNEMWNWTQELGIRKENLRWREHEEHERSHYSKKTMDIEYKYPFGWKEMFGIAYRTDFDLSNHARHTGKDLSYTDPDTGEKFVPHVIEPTFGLSRLVGIVLFDSYSEDGDRIVLKLNPKLAPYKAAVFPLLANKPELVSKARSIYDSLRSDLLIAWDERGNIGKRYFAQDEIGTPFCITVDFESLENDTVTVRDRDSATQERIKIENLKKYLIEKLV